MALGLPSNVRLQLVQSVPDDMNNQTDVKTLVSMGAVEAFYFNITQYPGGEGGVLHNKFIVTDSSGECLCIRMQSNQILVLKLCARDSGLLSLAVCVYRGSAVRFRLLADATSCGPACLRSPLECTVEILNTIIRAPKMLLRVRAAYARSVLTVIR